MIAVDLVRVATGAAMVLALALITLINLYIALSTRRRVADVQRSVDTGNATLIGGLIQHDYGMQSMDVDPAKRTVDQQDAVDMLSDSEHATHAETHPAPPPPEQ